MDRFVFVTLILAGIVLDWPAAAAEPVTLWGGAKAGASPTAVRAQFPGGRDVEEGYAIERTMLGKPATVTFAISDNALTRVNIGFSGRMDEAKSALRSGYGEPIGCEKLAPVIEQCRWRKGALDIKATAVSASEPFLSINYSASQSDNASF